MHGEPRKRKAFWAVARALVLCGLVGLLALVPAIALAEEIELRDRPTGEWTTIPGRTYNIWQQHAYVRDDGAGNRTEGGWRIVGVQVTNETPKASGSEGHVVTVGLDGNVADGNATWTLQAEEFGTATVTYTYYLDDDAQNTGTGNMQVTVTDAIYEVDVWPTGSSMMLPGGSAEYEADGRYCFIDAWGNEDSEDATEAGLTYSWSIVNDDGDYLSIAAVNGNPSKATVTAAGRDKFGDGKVRYPNASVCVELLKDNEVVASRGAFTMVSDEWYDVRPYSYNKEVPVGGKVSITPKVFHFNEANPSGVEDEGAQIQLGSFDNESLAQDPSGNDPYALKRLKPYHCWFEVQWRPSVEQGEDWDNKRYELDFARNELGFSNDSPSDIFLNANGVGTATITLNTEGMTGVVADDSAYRLVWTAGHRNENDEFTPWSDVMSVAGDSLSATIDGAKVRDHGQDDVEVQVQAFYGETSLVGAGWDLHVQDSEEDYRLSDDHEALVGWDDTIEVEQQGWIRNAEYPNGENFTYEILNVEAKDQQPATAGETVATVEEQTEDGHVVARHVRFTAEGTATVEVTYKDVAGEQKVHHYNVTVKSETFRIEAEVKGPNIVLPGGSVNMVAEGWHYEQDKPDNQDGIGFEWALPAGAEELATLTVDPNDPSRATITFKDNLPEGIWKDVDVLVTLTYNGQRKEGFTKTVHATVGDEFDQAWPTEFEQLEVGDSATITPEMRHYHGRDGGEYDLIEDVSWTWQIDRPGILEAKDNEDGTWTLTRLSREGTGVRLVGDWTEENGRDRSEDSWMSLDKLSYDIWFEEKEDNFSVDPDCAITFNLNTTDVQRLQGEIVVKVGRYMFDQEHEMPITVGELEPSEYSVLTKGANTRVTIPGKSVAAKGWEDFIVTADFVDAEGFVCGDDRYVVVDNELGHSLTKVAAKEPTTRATGNIEYWVCDKCGKLFLDQDATTPTTEAEVTLSKRVAIYRMYNEVTSEHLYTTSKAEYDSCGAGAYADWKQEGVGWVAPPRDAKGAKPVYRLYNEGLGDHHYTASEGEKKDLVEKQGWNDEGIAFYTAEKGTAPVSLYRLYNGSLPRGQHHYTASAGERDWLVANAGWKYEGVAFYGWGADAV